MIGIAWQFRQGIRPGATQRGSPVGEQAKAHALSRSLGKQKVGTRKN